MLPVVTIACRSSDVRDCDGLGLVAGLVRTLAIEGYVTPGIVALQWRQTDADFSICPEQQGQVFVCHHARLDEAGAVTGVAVLMGLTDQTSATIQPRIVQPSSQLSATIG